MSDNDFFPNHIRLDWGPDAWVNVGFAICLSLRLQLTLDTSQNFVELEL
jgi:hypothetical protein